MFCVGRRASERRGTALDTRARKRSPIQKAGQAPTAGGRAVRGHPTQGSNGKLAVLGLDKEILPEKGGRPLSHGHPPGGGAYGEQERHFSG